MFVLRVLSLFLGACILLHGSVTHAFGDAEQPTRQRKNTYLVNDPEKMERLGLTAGPLDDYLFDQDCPERGTLEKAKYYCPPLHRDKPIMVYLPYGYSEEQRYNVLILLPGLHGTTRDWFVQSRTSPFTGGLTGQTLLDNMIWHGDCEPLIVVSMLSTWYEGSDFSYKDTVFAEELRDYALPYIVANYSTYAKADGSDLEANRSHFALAGLSLGAISVTDAGLKYCSDLISWFGAFSYGSSDASISEIVEQLNGPFRDYPVDCLYIACGEQDMANEVDGVCLSRHTAQNTYMRLLAETEGAINEENSIFTWIGGNHRWNTWHICLYNALQLFFVDRNTETAPPCHGSPPAGGQFQRRENSVK